MTRRHLLSRVPGGYRRQVPPRSTLFIAAALALAPAGFAHAATKSVTMGGKFAARLGDSTAHGGSIIAGCPTVLIGG